MNKDQLWAKFCEINPSLGNPNGDKVPMTPAQIKKIVETSWKYAFNAGFDRGKEVTKSLNDLIDKSSGKPKDDFTDIFKDILNKKK